MVAECACVVCSGALFPFLFPLVYGRFCQFGFASNHDKDPTPLLSRVYPVWVHFQYGSLRKVGSPGPVFCTFYKPASLPWECLERRFLACFSEIRGSNPHSTAAPRGRFRPHSGPPTPWFSCGAARDSASSRGICVLPAV